MRKADYPIHAVFLDRWSPRAFTGEEMSDEVLMTCLEAGRWAPSSSNTQPWRFIYAKQGAPSFKTYLAFLNERNQLWAKNASVLVVLVSRMVFPREGKAGEEFFSPAHSFDTGAAWQNVALQATLLGWSAHGMNGFDSVKAAKGIKLTEGYHVELMFALGKRDDASVLPEALQAKESPRERMPLQAVVMKETFTLKPT